jgi:hypothetical protein
MNISAKDFLSQAYRIDQRINSKIEQVQSLRDLAAKATATLSDIPPSKGSRNFHRMEDLIAKMVDLESEINADIDNLIGLKIEIVATIKRVSSPELQTLLEMRYMSYMTWENIAVEIHYDLRHVHRLHGKALAEIEIFRSRCHEMP